MLEILNGDYNSLYTTFEAVFLMESRICKELVCASVLRNDRKSTLRRQLNLIKKQKQKQNRTNAQPEAAAGTDTEPRTNAVFIGNIFQGGQG